MSSKHDVPWYARGIVKIEADQDVQTVYNNADAMRKIDVPLLVIHGELDDVVPVDQGRRIIDASPSTCKRLIMVPGSHHNDLRYTAPPASTAVGEFLDSIVIGSENRDDATRFDAAHRCLHTLRN